MYRHMRMCAHTYTHAHTCTCAHTHIHMYAHMDPHVCTHMRAYIHACTYGCVHACTQCTHMCAPMYMHAHMHTCTRAHEHPHTRAHKPKILKKRGWEWWVVMMGGVRKKEHSTLSKFIFSSLPAEALSLPFAVSGAFSAPCLAWSLPFGETVTVWI